MNISKAEQRTLHALAQGGAVLVEKEGRRIVAVNCVNREGWTLADCTLAVFRKLRRRGFVASTCGGPYRITRLGRESVRAQLDNR